MSQFPNLNDDFPRRLIKALLIWATLSITGTILISLAL